MKFGLSFLPDLTSDCITPAEYFKGALLLSQFADKNDFTYVKMTEHYLHAYGGYCPDPLTFLAFIASATKNIRLMTGCILPVFHHPIAIAAKTAMVDCMSQGRLDVGFARAYLPHEFNAFKIPVEENWERFSQTLQTVQKLWTDNSVTVNTPFFEFKDAKSTPRCYQDPHPPIWGAAVNSRQSFAWLGENGYNLLVTPPLEGWDNWQERLEIYIDSFKSSQPVNLKPKIALSMPILLDDEESHARTEGVHYLQHYLTTWLDVIKIGKAHSQGYIGYDYLVRAIENTKPESMIANNQAIVGTAKQAIQQLRSIPSLKSIDYLLLQIDFGGQSYQRSMKTLEIFCNEPERNNLL